MDFVSDALFDGRRLRALTVVDPRGAPIDQHGARHLLNAVEFYERGCPVRRAERLASIGAPARRLIIVLYTG